MRVLDFLVFFSVFFFFFCLDPRCLANIVVFLCWPSRGNLRGSTISGHRWASGGLSTSSDGSSNVAYVVVPSIYLVLRMRFVRVCAISRLS